MFGASPTTNRTEEARDSSIGTGSAQAPDPISIPQRKDDTVDRNLSPLIEQKHSPDDKASAAEKKRRSSSVSKAKDIFTSARQSLHLHASSPTMERTPQTPMQKLSKGDPALGVPQGHLNNSAGESFPGPHSTFRVGVTEDRNKKCRRTMEDTHAYLYNFLSTPSPVASTETRSPQDPPPAAEAVAEHNVVETDNGYFAIFDGHAGTFAADWCGKKLHLLLEDVIRRNPNTPIPELLDQTFTQVDQQLEKLPVKNSGCTAVTAVLRWEDRVPNPASATGSSYINQAAVKVVQESTTKDSENSPPDTTKLQASATRQRVLYTANVGDARIVLCRNGRALRLSYDHKGSDESEGRRVANAGGLILNNRVNGVLAVTRALGDAYMKDLVTGHPYTTETVIQPDQDEFIILACDGLWDVCSDQEAVDLVRETQDAQVASRMLVDHALARFSTDNLSCMMVRFDNKALKARKRDSTIGVEGDHDTAKDGISEADAIVSEAKKHQDGGESGAEAVPPAAPNSIPEGVEPDVNEATIPKLNPDGIKVAQRGG